MSNAKASQNEREVFSIKLDEHLPFNGMATTMFKTSNELGKAVSDLFHNVFADFEGCIFEMPQPQNGIPQLPFFSLIFNHGEYDENAVVACERANGSNRNDRGVVNRLRYRDAQLTHGDRYILNDDGKDAIKPLLLPRLYNNGNPNWKVITGDFADDNRGLYGYPGVQYTKVSFIDPNRLCRLLYGEKNGDDNVDYHVSPYGPMNGFTGQSYSNYLLSIIRVSEKEVLEAYEKLGLGSVSRIIR